VDEIDAELGECRLVECVTAYRTWYFSWSRAMGKAVIGVTNWLSPKVSKPEIVCEVELNGKASANPRVGVARPRSSAIRCPPA
jgi:hypothetical protein